MLKYIILQVKSSCVADTANPELVGAEIDLQNIQIPGNMNDNGSSCGVCGKICISIDMLYQHFQDTHAELIFANPREMINISLDKEENATIAEGDIVERLMAIVLYM